MAQFHDALEGEDCDKELVDEVEDDSQLGRLVVVLHRHRRHIEQDLTPTHSLTHSLTHSFCSLGYSYIVTYRSLY